SDLHDGGDRGAEHHQRGTARRVESRLGCADAAGRGPGRPMTRGRGRLPPDDEGMPRRPGRPSVETPEAPLGPQPAEQPRPAAPVRPGRVHLVVVVTRAVSPNDSAPQGAVLVARFWHPSLHRWRETAFESLEHAMHLFVDESGWVLRQQQALDGPHRYELIF